MARSANAKRAKVRGHLAKAQSGSGLAEIVSDTVRLWRKHHLSYDQTKHVVEQVRRCLKLQPPSARRRTASTRPKSNG